MGLRLAGGTVYIKPADQKSPNFADRKAFTLIGTIVRSATSHLAELNFEEALLHSHWGGTTQVQLMQLFSQSYLSPKKAHHGTLWSNASQMHNVRVF